MLGTDRNAAKKLWQLDKFNRWWRFDWSWEGLASKEPRLAGGVPDFENLQARWWEEKDKLVEFAGRKWTRFHLPPFDPSGNQCPTEVWDQAKNSDLCNELLAQCVRKREYSQILQKIPDFDPIDIAPSFQGIVLPESVSFPSDSSLSGIFGDFSRAIFLGDVKWNAELDAMFQGTTFCGWCDFENATFLEDADFRDCLFRKNARFGRTTFSRNTAFESAHFSESADFEQAEFKGAVIFNSALFRKAAMFAGSPPIVGKAQFRNVIFARRVDFSNRTFEDGTDFSGASFRGTASFFETRFHSDTSFAAAQFHEGVATPREKWFRAYDARWIIQRYLWLGEKESVSEKRRRRARTKLVSVYQHVAYVLSDLPFLFSLRWPGMERIREQRDRSTSRYESSYRNLRRLCREIGNFEYEMKFHALELRAHRARTDAKALDRFASLLYDRLSDYGQSMLRPLLFLAASWFVAAGVYRMWLMPPYAVDAPGLSNGTCAAVKTPEFWAMHVAVGRQFLPALFGSGTGSNIPPDWLRCAASERPVLFFVVGLIQSLVFIVCAALFLIALRRRFRVQE